MKHATVHDVESRSDAGAHPFAGKVALVAGGYGAIGEGIVRGLARRGASVIIAGRELGKASALAEALIAEGASAHPLAFDARSAASIREAVESAAARHGIPDLLVNSLGVQHEQPLLEVTEEAFDEILDVNLKAAMFLGQSVARLQIASGKGGRHVHQLSVRALLGLRERGHSAYCASKGGLALLVKQHAMELAPHGITVNGVAPTVVRTPLAGRWLTDPMIHRKLIERIPLGRVADVEDVVGPTLFFLSDAASFVTGQILYVDGGVTASQ
ncbi:MAG: SDR family oxidoreductase [Betaproteobacteria bacterium]